MILLKSITKKKKEKNYLKRIKRIQRIEENERKTKTSASVNLSSKETDDLFKIVFRNYVHLISIADSKADY